MGLERDRNHLRLQYRSHQLVQRESRLRRRQSAARPQSDRQRRLNQLVGSVADENSFSRPVREPGQNTGCGRGNEFRISPSWAREYAIHDLTLELLRELVGIFVLIQFDVGLGVLQRVCAQLSNFRLDDV